MFILHYDSTNSTSEGDFKKYSEWKNNLETLNALAIAQEIRLNFSSQQEKVSCLRLTELLCRYFDLFSLGLKFNLNIAVKFLGHRSGTEGVTESRLLIKSFSPPKRGSSRGP